jgi:hypothetical protein
MTAKKKNHYKPIEVKTIKKDGTVSKKHTPQKKKTQEEQDRADRKLVGLNGLDEIFC